MFFLELSCKVFPHADFSCLILNTICYECNCLDNSGPEKDKLCVTTQQDMRAALESHTDPRERSEDK